MHVVVCGGGVIGATLAYFLSRRGVAVTLVERTGVACAASGKSGGFLALDWCDGTPLARLARRSFALHAELAATLDGDRWGYRRLDTWSVLAGGGHAPPAASPLGWLGAGARVQGRLGTAATTAQVHPARFTEAMLAAALARGARLRRGEVTGILLDPARTRARGVTVDGAELAADAVVLALGPWTRAAARWLPLPTVSGLKGNSILLATGDALGPDALFAELAGPDGATHTPELFPRADGTTYLCGLSSAQPLPDDPAAIGPDPGAADTLRAMAASLAPALATAPLLAVQACFRPVTRDGLPLIGPVPGVAGAYLATGHGVWGILNAPATGEAMAELVLDGATRAVDLRRFAPDRLPAASQSSHLR